MKKNLYILKDIDGHTALHLSLKAASSLVNANQQASFLANKDGISPLYLAIEAEDVSLVRAMLGNDLSEWRNYNLKSSCTHAALKSISTGWLL